MSVNAWNNVINIVLLVLLLSYDLSWCKFVLGLSQSSFHPFLGETESDPRLLFAGEHKLCCFINEVFVVQIMAVYRTLS